MLFVKISQGINGWNNHMQQLIQKLIQFFYKNVTKRIIFLMDPEKVHDRAVVLGKIFGNYSATRKFTAALLRYGNKSLEQNVLGINFKNPVGLAAGFDKNAEMTRIAGPLGFGFEEIGSVTGEPCLGNPKPRLWRLIKSKGIIVWYGLKNDGAEKIYTRLKNLKFDIPLGISVARTNSKEVIGLEKEIPDYIKSLKIFSQTKAPGDYFVINISCPNTCGGAEFHNPENLEKLLKEVSKLKIDKPIFIKIQPDLPKETIDKIIELAGIYGINGFIASNLTKHRKYLKDCDPEELRKVDPGHGGISGKPVEQLANGLIKYIYQKSKGKFVIIGVGGIFSAEDAYKKIRLGASLVQLITGMIFEGPQLIGQINYGLAKLLEKDGFKNISEAIGIDSKC